MPSQQTPAPGIDAKTVRAARAFKRRIAGRYQIANVYLFGSRARRTHRSDSDVDLAVVLRGETGDRSAAIIDMAGVAVEVMMESGILIEALPLWEAELERSDTFGNPALIRNLRRDGLEI